MRRLAFIIPFICVILACSYGQKKSAVGFSFNITDYQTPTDIKRTSLHNVLRSGEWHNGKHLDPGFSINYWRSIIGKIDFSARYNALFGSSTLGVLTNRPGGVKMFFSELEASAHARALKNNKTVNPFLSAGLGIGNYWENFRVSAYMPLGVGVQINIFNEAYVHFQANYRLSFNQGRLPNNLFYCLSISQSILRKKGA
jgi:hypothetical protein